MKFKKFASVVAMTLIPLMVVDSAMAAFGRGSSSGVSRSMSRPSSSSSSYSSKSSSSSYSKPSSSYGSSSSSYPKSTPSYSTQSKPSSNYNNYRQQPSYNSGTSNNYGGNNNYRQRSTMGDIGVGVAGVAGGILAAQAITALISSPGHAGMYTHPQYPGQYFNAQGVPQSPPQSAPVQQSVPQQQQYIPEQQYSSAQQVVPQVVQQQQVPQVVYQQQKSPGFFSILWSALFGVLHLIFFGLVVAGLGFFGFRMFRKGKKMIADQKQGDGIESEKNDLGEKAQQIFYGIQGNSNNRTYLSANTKYLPVADMMDEPSDVIQFEQGRVDVALESGKIRGSVYYRATLKKPDGTVDKIREYWNFEKEGTVWKLIGIDQA